MRHRPGATSRSVGAERRHHALPREAVAHAGEGGVGQGRGRRWSWREHGGRAGAAQDQSGETPAVSRTARAARRASGRALAPATGMRPASRKSGAARGVTRSRRHVVDATADAGQHLLDPAEVDEAAHRLLPGDVEQQVAGVVLASACRRGCPTRRWPAGRTCDGPAGCGRSGRRSWPRRGRCASSPRCRRARSRSPRGGLSRSKKGAGSGTRSRPQISVGVVGGDEAERVRGLSSSIRRVRSRPSVCCALRPAKP